MGNSPGGLRLLRDGDSSYHLRLGNSVTIDLKEEVTKDKGNGIKSKTRELSYEVEGSSCVLTLIKTTGGNPNDEKLKISIHDFYKYNINDKIHEINIDGITLEYSKYFMDMVRRAEAGLFQVERSLSLEIEHQENCSIDHSLKSLYTRKSVNVWGGVTETTVHMYESGTRKGLHVREWKKKREDHNPYMGTLAHYFVYSNISKRIDIGLSVVVKIRVLDDGTLNFDVEGPIQHPCSALFHMFEEVNRTGIWKPTSCPHCAINIQRQRNFMLSDSEDSDNNLPAAQTQGQCQNLRSLVANADAVRGNGNGNFIVKNLYLALRGRLLE